MSLNICRDCEEGKHGACMGTTFIEGDRLDPRIYEVQCDCEADGHEQ